MSLYEEPTNEFRQVRCLVPVPSGDLNIIHDEWAYIVQRKWYIYEGEEYIGPFNTFEREDALFVMFDTDRSKALWRPRRVEWRNLPIVSISDIK